MRYGAARVRQELHLRLYRLEEEPCLRPGKLLELRLPRELCHEPAELDRHRAAGSGPQFL